MSVPTRHACLVNAAAHVQAASEALAPVWQNSARASAHALTAQAWLALAAAQDEPMNAEDEMSTDYGDLELGNGHPDLIAREGSL